MMMEQNRYTEKKEENDHLDLKRGFIPCPHILGASTTCSFEFLLENLVANYRKQKIFIFAPFMTAIRISFFVIVYLYLTLL